MNILENLENLNVSEECFDDILNLVTKLLNEDVHSAIDTYAKTDKKGRDALHKKAANIQGVYRDRHPEEMYHNVTKNERGEQNTYNRTLTLDNWGVNKEGHSSDNDNLRYKKKSAIEKSINRFEKTHPWQVKRDSYGYTTGYEYKPKGYWKQNKK